MKIVPQEIKLLTSKEAIKNMVLNCEYAARTCYNSTDKITGTYEDAVKFLRILLDRHHESVIEHSAITFEFTTNIGVSREFERHRLANIDFESDINPNFSERSTRYCNYSKDSKYPNGIEFCFNRDTYFQLTQDKKLEEWEILHKLSQDKDQEWPALIAYALGCSEENYNTLYKEFNMKPEFCRHLLPLCTKTVFVTTCNLREWRHIIKMRTSRAAHPDIQELIGMVYDKFVEVGLGSLFEDVYAGA